MTPTVRQEVRRGFTIIELLIVVIVIGVLASAGVAKYQGFAETARQKTCLSNQATVENASAVWQTQNTTLPEDKWGVSFYQGDGKLLGAQAGTDPYWANTTKIADVVRDPKTFVCSRELLRYGDLKAVPTGIWALDSSANSCFTTLAVPKGNYAFCWSGPGQGTGYNGNYSGQYFYVSDLTSSGPGFQMVTCPGWGSYLCIPDTTGKAYKHSNRW